MPFQMNRAQKDFIARKDVEGKNDQDSRSFDVWYHPEDIERLVWVFYQQITNEHMYSPQVIIDVEGQDFSRVMNLLRDKLLSTSKKYLPFIIKPETGGVHWMAGIVRHDSIESQPQRCSVYLFNPTGYTNEAAISRLCLGKDQDRQALEIYGMPLWVSHQKVQSNAKDGGRLNSCGPIALEFMNYAMANPQWVTDLKTAVELPEALLTLETAPADRYREQILMFRNQHFEKLAGIRDDVITSNAIYDLYCDTTRELLANACNYLFTESELDHSMVFDNAELEPEVDSEPKTEPKIEPKAEAKAEVNTKPSSADKGNIASGKRNNTPFISLKSAVDQSVTGYCTYTTTFCRFSWFHRHGQTGRDRANTLQGRLNDCKDLGDLQQAILRYLLDPKNGNTHPHSFRTYLLKAVLPESELIDLKTISKDFNLYVETLKKQWEPEKQPIIPKA